MTSKHLIMFGVMVAAVVVGLYAAHYFKIA